ncbi:DMT family transporter [Bacillota bacterium]
MKTEIGAKTRIKGHIAAASSILIWGFAFISTKVLLKSFLPIEILFYRFILVYMFLFVLSPKPVMPRFNKTELLYIGAGFCCASHFLLTNVGLTYTLASNVGVLTAVAPLFTAIISYFVISKDSINRNFIIGFVITITGVAMINFNGNFMLKLNPLGDILILLGVLVWAVYCVVMVFINNEVLSLIQQTRKIFFYSLFFLAPVMIFSDFEFGLRRFTDIEILGNMFFLAFVALGISFLTWNFAVGILGSVKTATYLYFSPIVTIVASVLILHEPITWISLTGSFLIILGLVVSERKRKEKEPQDS